MSNTDYNPQNPAHRASLGFHLLAKLRECGFAEESAKGERVFSLHVKGQDRVRVKVYTSIVGDMARACGKDAIRVCAVYTTQDGKDRGIVKVTRVNRVGNVGAIVERVYQRMRQVYARAGAPFTCKDCGAPTFVSKKGNTVCAEACWARKAG